MALSSTQRKFLTDNLRIQPKRKLLDLGGKFTDYQLNGAVDAYLIVEQAILDQISQLRGISGAGPMVTNLERALSDIQKNVKAARRDGGLEVIKSGTKDAEKLKAMGQRVIDNKAFYGELDTAETTLKTLEKHPQRVHIDDDLRTATSALREARRVADEGAFKAARTKLAEGQAACRDGKAHADAYAEVMEVKASAKRFVGAMEGVFANEDDWQSKADAVVSEAAKAEPPQRSYDAAKNGLQAVITSLKDIMTDWYVTDVPADLTTLKDRQTTLAGKSRDGTTIIDGDVQKAEALRNRITSLVNAGNAGEAVMAADTELPKLLGPAIKAADRRLAYEAERETAVVDIQSLKDKKYLLGQMFSLNKLVEGADALASREAMRMEDGIKALQGVRETCKQLREIATNSEAYLTKRKEAQDKLVLLKQIPAAAAGAVDEQLAFIDKLMADSQAATGIIDVATAIVVGPNMEDRHAHQVDWRGAETMMKQALSAIAACEALAIKLGDATTAYGEAEEADTAEKIEKVAADIRKQAETAQKAAQADKAKDEYVQLFASLDEAVREAKAGRPSIGAIPLKGAAQLLIEAQTIQAERGRFDDDQKALEARLTTLTIMTEPPLGTVKSKTDPVPAMIGKAVVQADAKQWDKAGELLRAATAAVDDAEEMANLRKAFDAEATRIGNVATSLADPLKTEIGKVVALAIGKADAFDFAAATRLLGNAEARIASGKVAAKAASGTVDAEFLEALDKMMAATGGTELFARSTDNPSGDRAIPNGPELLDEIVKNLPGDVKMSVIEAIAKKRFGIDLKVSALRRTGGRDQDLLTGNTDQVETGTRLGKSKRILSAKRLYETLALTPEQTKDNPSLKKVLRENVLDSDGDIAGGGYYRSSDNLSSLSGRPGDSNEDFGADATGYKRSPDGQVVRDDAGNAIREPQLPPIEPLFQPANNDPIDAFDFASVHETGHAVDDRLGFMAARQNQAAYGGWIVHGSRIDDIAQKVAEKHGGDHADILKQYVLDKITGANPEPLTVEPASQAAVNTACKAIDEWHGFATKCKPWWNHGVSVAITMDDGRVYQEAYPQNWVSYPLAERSKGITGYQFRAPGEWFAELYAAYHVGKLKQGHPARGWLSSLSL